MQSSYASIIILKTFAPDSDTEASSVSVPGSVELTGSEKIYAEGYKQSTPEKRHMLLVEDMPQSSLVLLVTAISNEVSAFTLAVNVVIPAARYMLAWWMHDRLAFGARRWLLLEAAKSFEEGFEDRGVSPSHLLVKRRFSVFNLGV